VYGDAEAHGYGESSIRGGAVVQKDSHCLYEINFKQRGENTYHVQRVKTVDRNCMGWVWGGACGHEKKNAICKLNI
jgi:hypothetical protein